MGHTAGLGSVGKSIHDDECPKNNKKRIRGLWSYDGAGRKRCHFYEGTHRPYRDSQFYRLHEPGM